MSRLEVIPRENAAALQRRVIGVSLAGSSAALACACLAIWGLIGLDAAQRVWLGRAAGGAALAQGLLLFAVQRSCFARLRAHLRAGAAETSAGRDAAFRAVVSLPRRSALAAGSAWALGAVLYAVGMSVDGGALGVGPWLATLLAGATSGAVFAGFVELATKRALAAPRNALAEEFEDLVERRAFVRAVPLRARLVVAAGALSGAAVLLAVAAIHSRGAVTGFPWATLCGLWAVCTGVAVGLAWLLGEDLMRAGRALAAAAERAAAGDLRAAASFDAEDALGPVCVGLEGVVRSFRSTVDRVAQVVVRVEGTAGELASFATHAASEAESQLRGVEQAGDSLQHIEAQRVDLVEASAQCRGALERGRVPALEIGPALQALEEKDVRVSGRAEEIGASLDHFVHAVRATSESSQALTRAAREADAALRRMGDSVGAVDRSTDEAARLSERAVAVADRGCETVQLGHGSLTAAGEEGVAAAAAIRSVGARTTQIGGIADTIDDVADETNLLALNAAIIAAQAGEHGRAFGLVADEIKDLSNRVRASTREIGARIRAVERDTEAALRAVERSGEKVTGGAECSAEAARALEEAARLGRDLSEQLRGARSAIQGQLRTAGEAADATQGVRSAVEALQRSGADESQSGERLQREMGGLREELARGLAGTGEQTRRSGALRELHEDVSAAAGRVEGRLHAQETAARAARDALERIQGATKSGEEAAESLEATTQTLLRQAAELRGDLERFETWRFRAPVGR